MRLGFLVLAIAALFGAAEARAAVITIQQNRPQPASVRVYTGDAVVWVNADRASHSVIPSTQGWRRLQIAAQSAGRTRFMHPGRYRYTIDRATRGMVVVARRPAQNGGRRAGAPPATPRNIVFLADVTTSLSYPIGDCTDTWVFVGSFTMPRNPGRGNARGSGLGVLSSQPTCPFELVAPSIQSVQFKVLGRQRGRSAELRFALTSYAPAAGAASWAGLNAVFGIAVGVPAPATGGGPLVLTPVGSQGTSWAGMGSWSTPTAGSPFTASGLFTGFSD
jgi:plastocyanin